MLRTKKKLFLINWSVVFLKTRHLLNNRNLAWVSQPSKIALTSSQPKLIKKTSGYRWGDGFTNFDSIQELGNKSWKIYWTFNKEEIFSRMSRNLQKCYLIYVLIHKKKGYVTWCRWVRQDLEISKKKSRQGNGEKGFLKVIVDKCFWLVFNSEVLNKL